MHRRGRRAPGDAENDIALLRLAGVGIAMGHAPAAVRDAATRVTETDDRDGVALAIDALLRGGAGVAPPRG